jgi:hypothetical protein
VQKADDRIEIAASVLRYPGNLLPSGPMPVLIAQVSASLPLANAVFRIGVKFFG